MHTQQTSLFDCQTIAYFKQPTSHIHPTNYTHTHTSTAFTDPAAAAGHRDVSGYYQGLPQQPQRRLSGGSVEGGNGGCGGGYGYGDGGGGVGGGVGQSGGGGRGRGKMVCAVCQDGDVERRAQLFCCTGCRQV